MFWFIYLLVLMIQWLAKRRDSYRRKQVRVCLTGLWHIASLRVRVSFFRVILMIFCYYMVPISTISERVILNDMQN